METHAIEGRTVLVTGGTGSFGRWMIGELLKHQPKEIRIYSRDEEKQLDLSREISDKRITLTIGDVRDSTAISEATRGVDLIYHAAALKIIPTCEKNPLEALQTNILGTLNVKRAAIENAADKSILISTDKAVMPVNFYGMTKAIAEKIWTHNELLTEAKFAVVRYGNVVGSRGSIVPYFKELISRKKPLPITHPNMTRFLITLKQATALVLYATENMKGGEIYVPEIPACGIVDLAKVMGGENYPTEIVGIRPGEKIHECLIQEDEFRRTEEKNEYYIIHPHMRYSSGRIKEEFTSGNARLLTKKEIEQLLREDGWL